MYLKSQNEAAVENSRRVPTKDEARKWYADIKPIILCTDQGDNNKGVVLNQASKHVKNSHVYLSWVGLGSPYSIVKDSSADLGVNSKIVQIRPTVKAVCTKMSKKFFCIFVNILIFLNESREDHFEYFEYLRKTALY